MKYKYLILDANNFYWRCITSCIDKTNSLEESVIYNNSIVDFLKKLKEIINRFGYEDSIIYFLCDNQKSKINIRKTISEGQYKHSRENKNLPKNIYKTFNILIEILKNYSDNFRIVQCDGYEADDLTLPIKDTLKLDQQNYCLFISADLDWSRNIDDEFCHWFNFTKKHNKYTFAKKYGFSPVGNTVQLWKAIKGDNSDCIVNAVPHIRNEILLDILNRFKDVDDLFNNLWETDYPEKWKIRIKEKEANIRLNYKLVDFILLEEDINECIYLSKENFKILEFWFNTLSISLDVSMYKKSTISSFFEKKKYKRI